MKVYKLISTYFLVGALFFNSLPVIAGSKAAPSNSTSSAPSMDADTKTASDYQTCKKMLVEYKQCSANNPPSESSPESNGTPATNTPLKACQDSKTPSFIKSCTYCAQGTTWNEQFDDSDCEQIRTKATEGPANFGDNNNGASEWEHLFLLVTAYGAVGDSVCLAQAGPMTGSLIDMWIHASSALVYLAGEIVIWNQHHDAIEKLSKFEDSIWDNSKGENGGNKGINDIALNVDGSTQLEAFKKFKAMAEETKTAYNTKRNLMYVVGTGFGIAALTSIAMGAFKLGMSANLPYVAATTSNEAIVLSRCGVLNLKASQPQNNIAIPTFADLKKIIVDKFIKTALAAENKQSLLPGWSLLIGGIAVAVLAAAYALRKSINLSSYVSWIAGNFARAVTYSLNSGLAFMVAVKMSSPIDNLNKRIDVLNGIIEKLQKLENTALGAIETPVAAGSPNVTSRGADVASGLSVGLDGSSVKVANKSVLNTPDGVDCNKNNDPAECKKTMNEVATQLNSTFSEANMGSLGMAIDKAKFSPLLSSTLKGGVNSLRSYAMGLGGKNAISLGDKLNSDYSKKIKDLKTTSAADLNKLLVGQGKKAIDFEGEEKKRLAEVRTAGNSLTEAQKSDLAKSSLGGLGGPITTATAALKDLNHIDAPPMVSTTTEATVDESSGDFSASTDAESQLPTTPKVFDEKSFDNFVSEIKEKKHDRGDSDSIFSIVNKAYKRNAYPVLLRPKKEKIKVPVPPPQT